MITIDPSVVPTWKFDLEITATQEISLLDIVPLAYQFCKFYDTVLVDTVYEQTATGLMIYRYEKLLYKMTESDRDDLDADLVTLFCLDAMTEGQIYDSTRGQHIGIKYAKENELLDDSISISF